MAPIVTAGFPDLPEVGRQTRPRICDCQAGHPPRWRRDRRVGVRERIAAEAEVIALPRAAARRSAALAPGEDAGSIVGAPAASASA